MVPLQLRSAYQQRPQSDPAAGHVRVNDTRRLECGGAEINTDYIESVLGYTADSHGRERGEASPRSDRDHGPC